MYKMPSDSSTYVKRQLNPKNEDGKLCTSLYLFTNAVNDDTQLPIKWSALLRT